MGGDVSASYPLNNQAVYPTVQDIPDPSQGVKVQFTSAKRSETYPWERIAAPMRLLSRLRYNLIWVFELRSNTQVIVIEITGK